jgi:hypothetical protein
VVARAVSPVITAALASSKESPASQRTRSRGNFDGGVRPAGSDGPPPNVEIALVAEDVEAAYRIAVDAGCEPLATPL